MSVILGQRPLAMGLDAATSGIRRAQDRLASAAAEVASRGAAPSASTAQAKAVREASLPAQTPPNPGPPGGAQPGDLAEAMIAEQVAAHELAANVKTVQAFDEMLGELSRLGVSAGPQKPGAKQ
jgi:hypothetical protein